MIDFIAKLISGDGITTILLVVAAYIGLLWFLFSFWVYVDAKKRYKKTAIAIIYFVAVFVFSFPALIFYLITRPENEDDFVVLPADNLSNRGINVPIVNFIGKDGKVNLSFELRINNPEFLSATSDMAIDVNWKSENKEFQKEEQIVEIVKENEKVEVKTSKTQNVQAAGNKLKNNAVASINSAKAKVNGFKPKFSFPKRQKQAKKAN